MRANVALYVDGDDCYMVDGRFVSNCFGFREPTKVILTYEVSNNVFKVTVIKNNPIEILLSDGSDDESIIIPNPEGSHQSVEIVASSEEEDNAINYEVPNFRRFW
jgi:nitrous oxidase accessory protein NosD